MSNNIIPPILFLIFNRPETEKEVFEVIRKAKPRELYIAADGPRQNMTGEAKKCNEARKIIDDGINWDCRVHKLYRNKNLGCKLAVSTAIDWFFKNVKEGIILEDDCLPNQSFFRFCEVMLRKYKNNNKIFHIGASNFQPKRNQFTDGYYFSKYPEVWGWATWRRAWKYYDLRMRSWPGAKQKKTFKKFWNSHREKYYLSTIFDLTYSGKIDTWDYQWLYTIWFNGGLSIVPGVNLVQNIGFGKNSTHTKGGNSFYDVKPETMVFPLRHPKEFIVNLELDKLISRHGYKPSALAILGLVVKGLYFKQK